MFSKFFIAVLVALVACVSAFAPLKAASSRSFGLRMQDEASNAATPEPAAVAAVTIPSWNPKVRTYPKMP